MTPNDADRLLRNHFYKHELKRKSKKENIEKLLEYEKRFKEVAGLNIDMTVFPMPRGDGQQQITTKDASKERGYVTTPIFLVDKMICMRKNKPNERSLDLCAGEAGQFTIRLMRQLVMKYDIDPEEWLREWHYFSELNEDACDKLKYIYGDDINIFIGDSKMLSYLKDEDILHGSYIFNDKLKKWEKLS